MPLPSILADFQFADMTVRYVRDEAGRVGLTMFPSATAAQIVPHRESLAGEPEIDSMTDGTKVPAAALDSPPEAVRKAKELLIAASSRTLDDQRAAERRAQAPLLRALVRRP